MKERYLLEDGSDNGFSLITDYDGNDEQAFDVNVKSGEILPVLPLRNMVLFPGAARRSVRRSGRSPLLRTVKRVPTLVP